MIVAIEHQDVVATEVKYHRSCYASYTSQKTLDAILKSEETESRKQRSEYDIAFKKLASYITENVASEMEIITMKVLRERYLELLEEQGIENKEYRTEKLKTRMVKKFGSLLDFWHPSNCAESEIAYCDALPKGKLTEETYLETMSTNEENVDDEDFMKEDSDSISRKDFYDSDRAYIIYHAAKVLRSVLSEVSTMNPVASICFRHVRSKYQHFQPGIQLLCMGSCGGC